MRPHNRARRPWHLRRRDPARRAALRLSLLAAERVCADREEAARCALRLAFEFEAEDLRLVALGAQLLRDQHPDIWPGEGSVEDSVQWIAKTLCRVDFEVEECPHGR